MITCSSVRPKIRDSDYKSRRQTTKLKEKLFMCMTKALTHQEAEILTLKEARAVNRVNKQFLLNVRN